MSTNRNFKPQHFPVGSTFRVNRTGVVDAKDADKVWTVRNVVCNGLNSWCINTGEFYEWNPDLEIGFNLVHVTELVKRGEGRELSENQDTLCQMQSGSPWQDSVRHGRRQRWNNVFLPLRWEIERRGHSISDFDHPALEAAIFHQTWVLAGRFRPNQSRAGFSVVYTRGGGPDSTTGTDGSVEFDQRKFRRWISQNLNRFALSSKKKAAIVAQSRAEDERYERLYTSEEEREPYVPYDFGNLRRLEDREEKEERFVGLGGFFGDVPAEPHHWMPDSPLPVHQNYQPFRTLSQAWFDEVCDKLANSGFALFETGSVSTDQATYHVPAQYARSTVQLWYRPNQPFTMEIVVNELLNEDGSHGIPSISIYPHMSLDRSVYADMDRIPFPGLRYCGGSCNGSGRNGQDHFECTPNLEVSQNFDGLNVQFPSPESLVRGLVNWFDTHIQRYLRGEFTTDYHYLRATRFEFKRILPANFTSEVEAGWKAKNTAKAVVPVNPTNPVKRVRRAILGSSLESNYTNPRSEA